jgi:hypothetical protein
VPVMLFSLQPQGPVVGGMDSVTRILPGVYFMRTLRIGFHALGDTIRIGPGEAWCITLHMVRRPIEIEPINLVP